jgi:hypothetical protein
LWRGLRHSTVDRTLNASSGAESNLPPDIMRPSLAFEPVPAINTGTEGPHIMH